MRLVEPAQGLAAGLVGLALGREADAEVGPDGDEVEQVGPDALLDLRLATAADRPQEQPPRLPDFLAVADERPRPLGWLRRQAIPEADQVGELVELRGLRVPEDQAELLVERPRQLANGRRVLGEGQALPQGALSILVLMVFQVRLRIPERGLDVMDALAVDAREEGRRPNHDGDHR